MGIHTAIIIVLMILMRGPSLNVPRAERVRDQSTRTIVLTLKMLIIEIKFSHIRSYDDTHLQMGENYLYLFNKIL